MFFAGLVNVVSI